MTGKDITLQGLKQALPLFAALTAAGLAGNYFSYEIFFNIQFIFGSIFAMLALQMLGLRYGVLAAVLISSITYLRWNHPYAIIIMTAEVLFVGLLNRRKSTGIVEADTIYWVCIGMPLAYFFYHGIMHLPMSNTTLTMVKQTVNGIANTLAARLIFMAASSRFRKTSFSLRELVFNILAFFVLTASLSLLAVQSRKELTDTDRSIRGSLGFSKERISGNIDKWLKANLEVIAYVAKESEKQPVARMQQIVELTVDTHRDLIRIGIMDGSAVSRAYAPRIDELGHSNIGKSFADRDYLPALKQTLKPMLSEIMTGRVGVPSPVAALLVPIVLQGEYAGYVGVILNLQGLQQLIALNAQGQMVQGLLFTLVDSHNRVIVTNRTDLKVMDTFTRGPGDFTQHDDGISQWVPLSHKNTPVSERWKRSFYVAESRIGDLSEWKLILELPIAPVQKKLFEKYAAYFGEVFVMLLVALLLAKLLSQWLVSSLEELSTVSADVPSKLLTSEAITWPRSRIVETQHLVDNFLEMTLALAHQFEEIRNINRALEERVRERTQKLQESEQRFRSQYRWLPVPAYTWRNEGDDFMLIDCNMAAELITGGKISTYFGAKASQFYKDREDIVADMQTCHKQQEHIRREMTYTFVSSGETKDFHVDYIFVPPDMVVVYTEDTTERTRAANALRESEERLRLALSSAGQGWFDLEVQTGKVTVSPEYVSLIGYDPEEFSTSLNEWIENIHPEDRDAVVSEYRACLATGGPRTMEYRRRAKSGDWKWISSVGKIVEFDAGHKPVRMIGIHTDITGRKKAEEVLTASSARLKTLIDNIRDGVLFEDENRKILYTNQQFCDLFRIPAPPEALIGADCRNAAQECCSLFACPEGFLCGLEGLLVRQEVVTGEECLMADGRVLERDYAPIIIGGEHRGNLWTYQDITQRKQAEEQLRHSEQLLQDVTSNLGVGIYVFNPDSKISFMNPMAEHLWGWTKEELNEKGAHDLVHYLRPDGSPLPLAECRVHGVIAQQTAYVSSDEVFVRRDGTVFPVSIISTPLMKEGAVVGSVTAFRDITEDKKMEEEVRKAQKLESVGVLAGGIAHDFNNLLTGIMGNISLGKMFLAEGKSERVAELLDNAEEASEAAKELSFRLLTFSKGGDPVRKISSIEGILRRSAALALSGSNVAASFVLPRDLWPIEIDEGQMLQVFNNIIINAREAMPGGGTVMITGENITITGGESASLKKGHYAKISVKDTGSGISRMNLDRIFDPYFSTKGLGSRKGTGLGLSICMSVINKHDGHISVESQEGEGTTFHIWLPASAEGYAAGEPGLTKTESGSRKILFMDDDERIRNLVENMMEFLGCEVTFANNGAEAIEIFNRTKASGKSYDAVILDLTIQGGMGGDQAVKRLLEIDPGVKAVISSGYADSPVLKHFREYGFVEALAKPYRIEQLKVLLDKLFSTARPAG